MNIRYRRDLWKLLPEGARVAEIGVAEGRFSLEILEWRVKPVLYMVDRWQHMPNQKGDASNSQEWHNHNLRGAIDRVAPYVDRAIVLQGNSVVMAEKVAFGVLDLVYIDADHSYQGVLGDLHAWYPRVKPGGYIALHDYENPNYGVKAAVAKFCGDRKITIHLLPEDKLEDAGAYFQV